MVTLSSMEAEYVGSSEAARERIWLQRLLNDFTGTQSDNAIARFPETSEKDSPQLLYMDNQSAMKLAMKLAMSSVNQVHECTKHIDIRYHFVRDACQQGRIRIECLRTAEMAANILTTALPRDANQRHVKGMGLQSE
jgi:hypothetical protein